jgi:hypothetical protein
MQQATVSFSAAATTAANFASASMNSKGMLWL